MVSSLIRTFLIVFALMLSVYIYMRISTIDFLTLDSCASDLEKVKPLPLEVRDDHCLLF